MARCQICGKTTKFNFPLCKDCNDLKEQGKIVQCTDCGKWNKKDVRRIARNERFLDGKIQKSYY